jgi:hypothetical protein
MTLDAARVEIADWLEVEPGAFDPEIRLRAHDGGR